MATTSTPEKDHSNPLHDETNVYEVGIAGYPEKEHEVGEQAIVAKHYDYVQEHAEQLGGDPSLVPTSDVLAAVHSAVHDIAAQRKLAEEMGPPKLPHQPSGSQN